MSIRFDATPKIPTVRRTDAQVRPSAETADPQSAAQLTLGAALKRASESARAFGDSLTARFDEARKNSAREQVAQIRERIQMLKRLILLFGGSKALLRELKQLAGALAAAADVLKDGGGSGSAGAGLAQSSLYTETGLAASGAPHAASEDAAPAGDAATSTDEQRAAETLTAQAESELQAVQAKLGEATESQDREAATDPAQPVPAFTAGPVDSQQAQRRADADLLDKALRELKALVAAAKAAQRKTDRDDQKRLEDIEEHLKQVEQAVEQLNTPAGLLVGISVRA